MAPLCQQRGRSPLGAPPARPGALRPTGALSLPEHPARTETQPGQPSSGPPAAPSRAWARAEWRFSRGRATPRSCLEPPSPGLLQPPRAPSAPGLGAGLSPLSQSGTEPCARVPPACSAPPAPACTCACTLPPFHPAGRVCRRPFRNKQGIQTLQLPEHQAWTPSTPLQGPLYLPWPLALVSSHTRSLSPQPGLRDPGGPAQAAMSPLGPSPHLLLLSLAPAPPASGPSVTTSRKPSMHLLRLLRCVSGPLQNPGLPLPPSPTHTRPSWPHPPPTPSLAAVALLTPSSPLWGLPWSWSPA